MGGPEAAQGVASDSTQLQTELTSIDGIDHDRGHAQGNGDREGNRKQRGPHGVASSLARHARGRLAGATQGSGFGSWDFLPGTDFW